MLQRTIITTKEGTKTIQISDWEESYHSKHGILQEASHVFITHGLEKIKLLEINILEMGFGTGLNALLSLCLAEKKQIKINYYTLEKYPVTQQELEILEYWKYIDDMKAKEYYYFLHQAPWEKMISVSTNFTITKYQKDFNELKDIQLPSIHLVYFDAFGARVQPEFWEEPLFKQIYDKMESVSLLTTYSSKGSARRAMQKVGFTVQKIQGPQGKREMVNAWKE